MILKSFGCSFVYGNELNDCHGHASQLTWPALVAQNLGLEYQCYARPGSGNLQILNQILNQVSVEPAIYIVNWTWIDRFDYIDSYNDTWQTLLPNEQNANSNWYYKNIHSQFRDKLASLLHINTAINVLQQYHQKFIMTAMDELIFENDWHTNFAVSTLQHEVAPHIQRFANQNFLEWSRSNNYPESALWHPLEAAHLAAADYAIKNFIPVLYK